MRRCGGGGEEVGRRCGGGAEEVQRWCRGGAEVVQRRWRFRIGKWTRKTMQSVLAMTRKKLIEAGVGPRQGRRGEASDMVRK